MDEKRQKTIAKGLIETIERLKNRRNRHDFNSTESQDVDTIVCHADFLIELLTPIAGF